MDAKYRDRLLRVITDKDGVQWRVSEGHRPDRIRFNSLEGEDQLRQRLGKDVWRQLEDVNLGAQFEKTRRHGFAEAGAAARHQYAPPGEKLIVEHGFHPKRLSINWSID